MGFKSHNIYEHIYIYIYYGYSAVITFVAVIRGPPLNWTEKYPTSSGTGSRG